MKSGQESEFCEVWHALTIMIREHQGSLGSRLHVAGPNKFIAYAQWPSRTAWKAPSRMPPMGKDLSLRLKECCESIEVLHELDVVDDLLG